MVLRSVPGKRSDFARLRGRRVSLQQLLDLIAERCCLFELEVLGSEQHFAS